MASFHVHGYFWLALVLTSAAYAPPAGNRAESANQSKEDLPQKTATELSRVEAVEAIHRRAEELAKTDLRKAAESLEAVISENPDDPARAKLYLLLGRIKREYETIWHSRGNELSEVSARRAKEIEAYAKARPKEYGYNEINGIYLYTGVHFTELMSRFPDSPFALDAAYEMTKLSKGGECEGEVTCYINARFFPVRNFLQKYPDSKYSAEAVQRANKAFQANLRGTAWKTVWGEIQDPQKGARGYDPHGLKRLVQEYEDLAGGLTPQLRASAYEAIAYYRVRLGETSRARELYSYIVREVPDYANLPEVRKALAALP